MEGGLTVGGQMPWVVELLHLRGAVEIFQYALVGMVHEASVEMSREALVGMSREVLVGMFQEAVVEMFHEALVGRTREAVVGMVQSLEGAGWEGVGCWLVPLTLRWPSSVSVSSPPPAMELVQTPSVPEGVAWVSVWVGEEVAQTFQSFLQLPPFLSPG